MKKSILFLFVFLGVLGCSSPRQGETIRMNGAGATFPYPLYSKWFNEYHKLKPAIQINYQSIGSGGGIQQIKAKTVDFGASDAPLSPEEEKSMPAPVIQIPTTAGAVVLAYNLSGVTQGLKLSADILADIYLGKLKNWNDPKIVSMNPGVILPDLPIAVVHRSDGSGTTFIFTDYLAKVSSGWTTQVGRGKSVQWPVGIGAKGNEGVAGQIKMTPGSIGYIEYVYAMQNKLTHAAIQNQSGKFVEAGGVSTKAALTALSEPLKQNVGTSVTNAPGEGSYPIVGLTYLIIYKTQEDARKGQELLDFLKWAMSDGQKIAEALYYSPLPAELIHLNETKIATIAIQ